MGQPEFYLSAATERFADGALHDATTKQLLKGVVEAFVKHVKRFEATAK